MFSTKKKPTVIVKEFIGILVLECKCGEKFVVTTEAIKQGFWFRCKECGHYELSNPIAEAKLTIEQRLEKWDDRFKYEERQAMQLDEYKTMLAECILAGKKPKIAKQHKAVVVVEDSKVDIVSIVEALRTLGFCIRSRSFCAENAFPAC